MKSAGLEQSLLLKIDDFRNHLTSAKISVIEAILNEPEFIRRYDGLACILCDIDPNVNRYITSDVPYVRLPGLTQQLHLAPLSPTRCLVMSNQRELVEGIKRNTNEHFVDFVNFAVMSMSNEIYAWDDRVRPDVAEYLGLMREIRCVRGKSWLKNAAGPSVDKWPLSHAASVLRGLSCSFEWSPPAFAGVTILYPKFPST